MQTLSPARVVLAAKQSSRDEGVLPLPYSRTLYECPYPIPVLTQDLSTQRGKGMLSPTKGKIRVLELVWAFSIS